MAPEPYMEESIRQIKDKVRYECLYLDLPADEIEAAIDDDEIKSMITFYTGSLTDALIYNKELVAPSYPSVGFLTLVRDYLSQIQSPASTVDIDAAAQEISGYLTDIIDQNVNIVSAEMVAAFPRMNFLKQAAVSAGNLYWVFLVASIVFVLILLLINRRKLLGWLYNCAACIWISSSFVFIPTLILIVMDIPSRISVSGPLLGILLENVIDSLLDHLFYPSLVLFILSTAWLTASILLTVKKDLAAQRKAEILGYEP